MVVIALSVAGPLPLPASADGRWDGYYRVRSGDTLSRIARRHGVSVGALQRHNRLRNSRIREGRQLRIPGRGMGRVRAAGARPAVLTDAQERALERAETLGLSARTGNLLLVNPPEPRWLEAAGSSEDLDGTLLVPVEGGRFLRGWGSGQGGYHLALDIGQPLPSSGRRSESGSDRGVPDEARSGVASSDQELPEDTPSDDATPEDETDTSGNDETADDTSRDPAHPTIRSAEQGLVLYAGNGIRGYGNIVIVLHPNGVSTWYAHNHQNLVVPGQQVARGEAIGTMGQTGYARGTHLHFMVVDGLEHCDPTPLLEGRLTTRNGEERELDDEARLRWTDTRPESLRCATRAERPHPRRRRRRRRSRR